MQWHLSDGNDPCSFSVLHGGSPVLTSDVGTGGVRDISRVSDGKRERWFTIATGELSRTIHFNCGVGANKWLRCADLDVNAEGFSWGRATRTRSPSLVVWESADLVEWSEPRLVK